MGCHYRQSRFIRPNSYHPKTSVMQHHQARSLRVLNRWRAPLLVGWPRVLLL